MAQTILDEFYRTRSQFRRYACRLCYLNIQTTRVGMRPLLAHLVRTHPNELAALADQERAERAFQVAA